MIRLSNGKTYVSLTIRQSHKARHGASLRRSPLKALHSMAREAGNFLWGAFTPVREAW